MKLSLSENVIEKKKNENEEAAMVAATADD